MSLIDRRRKVAAAELRVRVERARWKESTRGIRQRFAGNEAPLIVGGGLLAGVVTGLLPLRSFARLGGVLAGAVSFALRSPIGAMLMEGIAHQGARAKVPTPPAAES